ncbi:MAG: hypothetical protein WCA77_03580 [Thermoplasmata archaeon]
MRSPYGLALAVLLLLTVSTSCAPLASAHASTPAGTPAANGVSIQTVDQLGYSTTTFYVGGSNTSHVYFAATDPLDAHAIVAINDGNALRDGLTNPVATWNITFSAGVNQSASSHSYYALPTALADGGQWNITMTGIDAGFVFQNFTVDTFYAQLVSSNSYLLPGQSVNDVYYALSTASYLPYPGLSSVTVTGSYETNSSTTVVLPGFPLHFTSATGNFTVAAPGNAWDRGSLDLTMYANATDGQSLSDAQTIYMATLLPPALTFSSCPSCASQSVFGAGSTVYLSISDFVLFGNGDEARASDVSTTLVFRSGTTNLTPSQLPGVPLTLLTLNSAGQAVVLFTAGNPPFSPTLANVVNVTVHDPSGSAPTNSSQASFYLASPQALPGFSVSLQHSDYYSGQTVNATWQLGDQGAATSAGWSARIWEAVGSSGSLFAFAPLSGSVASGVLSFVLPPGYTGPFYVEVLAANATLGALSYTEGNVTGVGILLTPSESSYLPGDTVTIDTRLVGPNAGATSLYASVITPSGGYLLDSFVSGSSFQFTVPTSAPPSQLAITVLAESSTYGIVGMNELNLSIAPPLTLTTAITTVSNYADGSFQPGQTLHISYTVVVSQGYPVPNTLEVGLAPFADFETGAMASGSVVQTTGLSGTFDYTIPSSQGAGTLWLVAWAALGPPTSFCGVNCTGPVNLVSFTVEPNPSVLNYELGAGSGVTVGWLILLIAIVVVAIVLVVLIRRRGRPYAPTKPPVQAFVPPTESLPPPTSSMDGNGGPTAPGEIHPWTEAPETREGPSPDSPPLPPPANP